VHTSAIAHTHLFRITKVLKETAELNIIRDVQYNWTFGDGKNGLV
jgi:hypothetical protein